MEICWENCQWKHQRDTAVWRILLVILLQALIISSKDRHFYRIAKELKLDEADEAARIAKELKLVEADEAAYIIYEQFEQQQQLELQQLVQRQRKKLKVYEKWEESLWLLEKSPVRSEGASRAELRAKRAARVHRGRFSQSLCRVSWMSTRT